MTYNTTFMDQSVSILDLAQGIGNNLPYEFLFGNIILILFFMLFLSFAYKFPMMETLIINGFLTTVLSILLWTAGLIATSTIIYPAVLTFIILIFFFING